MGARADRGLPLCSVGAYLELWFDARDDGRLISSEPRAWSKELRACSREARGAYEELEGGAEDEFEAEWPCGLYAKVDGGRDVGGGLTGNS